VFDGTSLSLGTVGAKVNFATTGSATVNYVGGSADGYSLEMVMQRGASQPLKYKQDYGVGHVWSIAGSDKMTLDTSGNLGLGVTPSTGWNTTNNKAIQVFQATTHKELVMWLITVTTQLLKPPLDGNTPIQALLHRYTNS
jgi:hypothetical protein